MPWSKPDFVEITLCMEVSAYVNTDEKAGVRGHGSGVREEEETASSQTSDR
jgi:coenzyme PQQ precursor peptide PqqA